MTRSKVVDQLSLKQHELMTREGKLRAELSYAAVLIQTKARRGQDLTKVMQTQRQMRREYHETTELLGVTTAALLRETGSTETDPA